MVKSTVLKILFTSTNILCVLTCIKGNILFWTSIGAKKIKGTKKITLISTNSALKEIITKLNSLECKFLHLQLKGFNRNKRNFTKFFKNSSINIISICDKTALPHNGCKKKKIRRI
uniref:ribosomal protein S11 n=1 Tax=Pterocladiella capillacea TaxID=70838 RepID=UPI002E788965|nr:ribosomal protein S11 [Pterocladiella capillacea]WQB61725.1 ribosomal protein S11 [Pterocladiella capillacea]